MKTLIIEAHHGDCIGADAEFHELIRKLCPDAKLMIHPPIKSVKRAYCEGDVILPARTYLSRNKDIVDSSDVIFAAPAEEFEILRSGTWATIRYARKHKDKTLIVYAGGCKNDVSTASE